MIEFDPPPPFQPLVEKNFEPPPSSLHPPPLKKNFPPPPKEKFRPSHLLLDNSNTGSPCRTPIGCLERVIRTAVRLIGGIPRTGRISGYMLDILLLLSLKHRIAVLQHWPGGVRSGLYLQNLCCRILGCQVFGI